MTNRVTALEFERWRKNPLPMCELIVHVGARGTNDPALLDCRGDPSCGKWVAHALRKRVHIGRSYSVEVLWECLGCGSLRRWGIEDCFCPACRTRRKVDKDAA